MTEIEKIRRYIDRTGLSAKKTSPYQMNIMEVFEFAYWAFQDKDLPIEAFSLAFNYGLAKGYRMAKAEAKS